MPTEIGLGRSITDRPFFLSKKQREVLSLAAQGLTDVVIAQRLGRSPRTVRFHLQAARRALRAENTCEAVVIALYWQLIDFEACLRPGRNQDAPEARGHKNRGDDGGERGA